MLYCDCDACSTMIGEFAMECVTLSLLDWDGIVCGDVCNGGGNVYLCCI